MGGRPESAMGTASGGSRRTRSAVGCALLIVALAWGCSVAAGPPAVTDGAPSPSSSPAAEPRPSPAATRSPQPSATPDPPLRPSPRPSPPVAEPPASLPELLGDGLDQDAIHRHIRTLVSIAEESGGTRAAATAGEARARRYVREVLEAWGYAVEEVAFRTPVFVDEGRSRIDIAGARGVDAPSVRPVLLAQGGVVRARVVSVGYSPTRTGHVGAGCSAGDYRGFPRGAIALMLPGWCDRWQQIRTAERAGAAAVILAYWYADSPDMLRRPSLAIASRASIPAVAVTAEAGRRLGAAARAGRRVELEVTARTEPGLSANLIAQTERGDARSVLVVGAHLDTFDSIGANDDASGVAVALEIARLVANADLDHQVRFIFFGAEEQELLGSRRYLAGLDEAERRRIAAYLNIDTIGTSNGVRFILQEAPDSPGASRLRDLILGVCLRRKTPCAVDEPTGSTDARSFLAAGIPAAGISAGAFGDKSVDQARRFGGQAGKPLDPCLHLACDAIGNLDLVRLREMAVISADVVDRIAGVGAVIRDAWPVSPPT